MTNIIIRKSKPFETTWINDTYTEIGFMKSNYRNEYISVAEIENKKCGLGRLVEIDNKNKELGGIYVFPKYRGMGVADAIVNHLLRQEINKRIWCLPFSNLLKFYQKFGFKEIDSANNGIPETILSKHSWCNQNYEKEVLLLAL